MNQKAKLKLIHDIIHLECKAFQFLTSKNPSEVQKNDSIYGDGEIDKERHT